MSSDRILSLNRVPALFALVGLAGAAMLLAGNAPAQPASDPTKTPTAAPQPLDGGTRQPGRGPGGPGGDRAGSLEGAMKQLGGALKALKEIVDKSDQKDQSLIHVGTMQRACLTAKSITSPTLKGDPKDAAKTLVEFRRAQIKLMGMLLELETQILDGKLDAARESVKKLGEYKESSHDTFEPKKERGARGTSPRPEAAPEKK
ncbi:MAG: cytochrome b562 [Planctomycetota bacterium]